MNNPLKIGIILQSNSNWMGGILYTKNLINVIYQKSLKKKNIEIHLFTSSDSSPIIYEDLKCVTKSITFVDFWRSNFINKLIKKLGKIFPFYKDRRLSIVAARKNLTFLYPILGYNDESWDFDCDWAAWIPDFQHKYLPALFSQKEINSRNYTFARISREAKKIAFSSQIALDDFKGFYPNSKAKTYVLRFNSISDPKWYEEDPFKIQRLYDLPDRFFVVCNQFWKHKNHRIIVDALCLLRERKLYPVIVCTGKLSDERFPEYVSELTSFIRENDLGNQFHFLGLIPRSDQIQLMRRSLCVIQPSIFEGWSSVVEDARLLGKPVILSDIPVHKEQNPPSAYFFQHESHEDLAEKISNSLSNLSPGPDIFLEKHAEKDNLLRSKSYIESFFNMVLDKKNND
jgi:glycosyltransferase involved in cell wall biosynthesis